MVSRRRPTYRINKTRHEQIHQEEIYRRDIRHALEKQDTKQTLKQKIWVAINSAFFLWFLSTVVVGSIAILYTQHTERSKESEQDQVAIRKLDTEIKSRLYYVATQIDPKRIEDINASNVLLSLEKPSLESYPINVFPEYEKRNMRSLLWELHTLVPQMEKVEIESALNAAFHLRNMYEIYLELYEEITPSSASTTSIIDLMLLYYVKKLFVMNLATVPVEFRPFDLDRWDSPFTNHWVKQKDPDVTK